MDEIGCVRHIRFQEPALVTINGTTQKGIIRKSVG